ncbi:DeoR/GlpR transcriptional regulator [Fusibacter paucivorans]|uniref:DeoR/GlpR transcriptional regulator n=1 Tax=Fusibacter paucivorans TaxID=76009 RepID=A0ABS5PKB5_9FIRM|nr:DeoR/GlpR family DNA-binding transcription regulator [Fusibacter paucivorans]MBS7525453.1 DeoR/GlpR transcriptional regulator [Fusibacter paucivorans]
MFAEERKREILRLLHMNGKVRNLELAQKFAVSEPTIRKDISELEEQHLLIRTHGGAMAIDEGEWEPTYIEKSDRYQEEKRTIGFLAAMMIKDHDVVILDAGTTTVEIAKRIKAKHFTVITNSLDVANVLENNPDCEIIMTGGMMRWKTHALVGPLADKNLQTLSADIAFIGTNGISKDGFSTPNLIEAETKATMIKRARRNFIVSDNNKFGHVSLAYFADLTEVDGIITDQSPNKEFFELFEKSGVDLIMKAGDSIDINGNTEPGN